MRNRYILILDLVGVLLSVLGAFVLRLDWLVPLSPTHAFADAFRLTLVSAPLVKLPLYYFFGLYGRYWRHVGLQDMLPMVVAVSAASVTLAFLVVVGLGLGTLDGYPRSVLAIDWVLSLLAVTGVRIAVRVVAESRVRGAAVPEQQRRVLIAGAGEAGTLVAREIQRNPQIGLKPIGFLDDQAGKLGKQIHGLRVIGRLNELAQLIPDRQIDEVIIAMPTAPGSVVRALADTARQAGVPARALPGVFELLDGGITIGRLRNVDITDLLRRRPIVADAHDAQYVEGRTVLVTGAGGSIGSELCRQAARARAGTIILAGHGENSIFDIANQLTHSYPASRVVAVIVDVRDADGLRRLFATHRPDVVFHAAAHKHVPLMEAHPHEAISNNVRGTQLVVEAALAAGVDRFVLISTDKAVAPGSVMGASKKVAEMLVRDAARRSGRRFLAVRFGNVLGSRGSVVPYFRKQIESGGPVTVTHPDMTRYFMTIPEAVYLVLKAGGMAHGGELFVLNMGDPVRIVDLATDLIRLSGCDEEEISIVYSGLRPGEKLTEHLWEPGSRVEPVGTGDVLRVQEPDPLLQGEALLNVVERLRAAASRGDTLAIHHILSDVLPTFVSSLHADAPPANR